MIHGHPCNQTVRSLGMEVGPYMQTIGGYTPRGGGPSSLLTIGPGQASNGLPCTQLEARLNVPFNTWPREASNGLVRNTYVEQRMSYSIVH